jgi:phosphate-selective porin OprO/OprP
MSRLLDKCPVFSITQIVAAALVLICPLCMAETEIPENGTVFGYEKNQGLVLETRKEGTSLWLGLRLQLRYTNLRADPVDPEMLSAQVGDDLRLNRGRIKLGGHVLQPWLNIYSEYDFTKDSLLDYRVTLNVSQTAMLRAGQWKTEYNRERVDSSGKQQFVDRSIANYWFTLDRQLGASLQGRIGAGHPLDSSYWLAIVSGEGRGGKVDDRHYLGVLRYQWNLLRREVPFSQSDIMRRKKPVAALSLGGAYGHTQYTRYSSSGGGQLPGYEGNEENPYELRQVMQGSLFQGHGFSWQQELHGKRIQDRSTGIRRNLWGGYMQCGYFLNEAWGKVPAPLELALRYGLVDPDTSGSSDWQQEHTVGMNWFFNGHRSKLTSALSYLTLDAPSGAVSEWRSGVQWDVSF